MKTTKRILVLLCLMVITMGAWADWSVTIGSDSYPMSKVDGVSPDTYTVTVPLEAGSYSATVTDGSGKKSDAATFSIRSARNVTFWGRYPAGRSWIAILTNACEYGLMNNKWRYLLFTNTTTTSQSISYYVSPGAVDIQAGTGTKATTDDKIMTSKQAGNPPFGITKNSTTKGIKKVTLDYANWNVIVDETGVLPVTIGASGVATLAAPVDLTIPANVKAYTLKYVTDHLVATEITATIPRNTPVLLNAEVPDTYNFTIGDNFDDTTDTYAEWPYKPDVTSENNVLLGVMQPHYVPTNSYVLQDGKNGLGFYNVGGTDNYRINQFRCYITLPEPAAHSLSIVFDDGETTGIADVRGQKEDVRSDIFNLSGQRVGKDYKGVVIKNGRKMIQK